MVLGQERSRTGSILYEVKTYNARANAGKSRLSSHSDVSVPDETKPIYTIRRRPREYVTAVVSMPQTEEAAMWFAAVYQAVREIPYGKATSYGHIATLIGYRA